MQHQYTLGDISTQLGELRRLIDDMEAGLPGIAEQSTRDDDLDNDSEPAPAQEAVQYTRQDCADLVLEVYKNHGRDRVARLMSEFGVGRVTELDDEALQQFGMRAKQVAEGTR